MKNWVIHEDKETVYKIGEFFIQFTLIESFLEKIYSEFVPSPKARDDFSGMTFGKKIYELSQKVKIGERQEEVKSLFQWSANKEAVNIITRLFLINEFRNGMAHNVFEYNPTNKKVYIQGKDVSEELDIQIAHIEEFVTDLFILHDTISDKNDRGSMRYKECLVK